MSTSRRYFLRAGIMAGLFAGLCFNPLKSALGQDRGQPAPAPGTLGVLEDPQLDEVFYFTKSTFDPYINTEFIVRTGRVITTLILVQTTDCNVPSTVRSTMSTESGECFILIFKANRKLPQGVTILTLEHSALGKFDLFLGNWKNWKDPKGIYYQAVINHTHPADEILMSVDPSTSAWRR